MGIIICGERKYNVSEIPNNAVYRIGLPVRSRKELETAIMQDLAALLVRGYQIVYSKTIPIGLENNKEKYLQTIKYDLLEKDEQHDKEMQKEYLKETRKIWEARYNFNELLWMIDFQYFIAEIGGDVSDNWYIMYVIIRGDLPFDFPTSICFAKMIENVYDWKAEKYVNQKVKEVISNKENLVMLQKGLFPLDLEIYPEIGLTEEIYVSNAKEKDA